MEKDILEKQQRKIMNDMSNLFNDCFPTLFEANKCYIIEKKLIEPKEMKILEERERKNVPFFLWIEFMRMIQKRENWFEPFVTFLSVANRHELKQEVLDRYFVLIANLLCNNSYSDSNL